MNSRSAKRQARSRVRYLDRWTLQRAGVTGGAAALGAILVAIFAPFGEPGVPQLYAVLLALTAFCGASILFITLSDMRRRGAAGSPRRAIRSFDGALGLVLLTPSLLALSRAWGEAGFPTL